MDSLSCSHNANGIIAKTPGNVIIVVYKSTKTHDLSINRAPAVIL